MCHSISRGHAAWLRDKPLGIEARAPGLEANAHWRAFTGCNTAVREGAAAIRGNVSPRAASGGPIHARLAPGNSAVTFAHAPLRREVGFCANPPLLTRTALEASPAPQMLGLTPAPPPAAGRPAPGATVG